MGGRYAGTFGARPLTSIASAYGAATDDMYSHHHHHHHHHHSLSMAPSSVSTGGRSSPTVHQRTIMQQDDWSSAPASTSGHLADHREVFVPRHQRAASAEWDASQFEAVQRLSNGQIVCRFFRQGYCSHGERCKFPHIGPQLGHQLQSHAHQQQANTRGANVDPSALIASLSISGPSSTANTRPGSASGGVISSSSSQSPVPHSAATTPSSAGAAGASSAVVNSSNGPATAAGAAPTGTPAKPAHVKGHKRNASSTDGPRFPPLEQLKGQIYSLCKDQHGCRYLQKRLEENNELYVTMIYEEAFEYMAELMSGKAIFLNLFFAPKTTICAQIRLETTSAKNSLATAPRTKRQTLPATCRVGLSTSPSTCTVPARSRS